MHTDSSFFQKPSFNNNIWLISFGDLLTLVLCFFISVISISPLNPEIKSKIQSGTQLAHNNKEIERAGAVKKDLTLSISENDLFPLVNKITNEGLERLKKLIPKDTYNIKGIRIESCKRGPAGNNAEKWSQSASLISELRSQLIDDLISYKGENIDYRQLATDCQENTVARVILNFK